MDYLVLVNESHPFKMNQLLALKPVGSGVYLEQGAASALMQLLKDTNLAGKIVITSGFRTLDEQRLLYEKCLKERGQAYTEKYVAKPGCSEHHTGLAADLGLAGIRHDEIAPTFDGTPEVALFKSKMKAYGFILRYPAHKTHITKIVYEPWHIRYVGVPFSQKMTDKDLTLEEFWQQRKHQKIMAAR